MKKILNKIVCSILIVSVFLFSCPPVSFAASSGKKKIKITDGKEAEEAYYRQDYGTAVSIFDSLRENKDKNYALWNNQLGSIYLAKGDCREATDAFLKAHYLMNDIAAFKELESGAVSLIGAEAQKAYKGDPYEKVFNSLYVALLLYAEGDLDNALAACKNGILCDSDVQADMYQSDVTALYLLASRINLMLGNNTASTEYYNKALEAYCLTWPTNRPLVGEEQGWLSYFKEKQEELKKLDAPEKKSKAKIKKIETLNVEIGKIESDIKALQDQRQNNDAKIDPSALKDFLDLKNNTLLILELGRGPLKYQIGQYGQYALFTNKPCRVKRVEIMVDGNRLSDNKMFMDSDVYFQARTRGGREMDSILKGKAQFKQTTADMAMGFMDASRSIINTANQQAAANPYSDNSGALMLGAGMAVIGLVAAVASAAANPTADVRHWSLMPSEILILPANLSTGQHSVQINCYGFDDQIIPSLSSTMDIDIINDNNNTVFKRLI
ncbi:MAG: hypothetical protein ISS26_06140 [Candidatus Omnitrophica bacterium]|nr:hypothetical protein [Candidatus Omnitrophota bacterium]